MAVEPASSMSTPDFGALVARHRNYFLSGATRSAEWRKTQLIALRSMMKDHAEEFYAALWTDLRRNRTDADWTDVKYMTSEIDHVLAHLRRWMKPLAVSTPLVLTPSHTQVQFDPLGVGLIIGTWNYPVMMVLSPLVSAISSGERGCYQAIGSISSHRRSDRTARPRVSGPQRVFSSARRGTRDYGTTGAAMGPHLFYRWLDRRQGGHDRGSETFDTQSCSNWAGRIPPSCTPQPTCASRRTASPTGAGSDSGQTCTAPDYVLVFKDVAKAFLGHLKETLLQFYGEDPQKSPDYGRIASSHHFDRLTKLLSSGTIFHGGQHDGTDRFIAPTVLVNVSPDSPAMQEEIFGPILPVLEVADVREVIDFVNARPSPLGLYLFSDDRSVTKQILNSTTSGDACVNDCTLQPILHDLPFGGVGNSGMGKYHGEWGFRTYTNARGVLYHSTRLDSAVRYPPYDRNQRLREFVLKSASMAPKLRASLGS